EMAYQVYNLSRVQAHGGDVFLVQENDAPPVTDAAIAIVQRVSRGIKLIVTANWHHQNLIWAKIVCRQILDSELGLAACRVKKALASRVGKMEAAGATHSPVVVVKPRHSFFDRVANLVVVTGQVFPIDGGAMFECGPCETCDDLWLAQEIGR